MTAAVTDMTNQPVPAGSTPQYSCQLLDANGNDVPLSAVQSLTLSIVDTQSGAVVNDCDAQNILNARGCSLSGAGALTLVLETADTALLLASDLQEYRSLIIDWGYDTSLVGRHQVDLLIVALAGP